MVACFDGAAIQDAVFERQAPLRRAFAELSAAARAANAALPPGAGMDDPCAFCGGARPHGKNDEFLPCCGVSVCSGCSMAASMRGVPCGKCGKTVPQMPNDLLDAYARLAAAVAALASTSPNPYL